MCPVCVPAPPGVFLPVQPKNEPKTRRRFSALYGIGAIFSAASVFIVQGSLTLFGTSLDALLTERMRLELFAAGGLAVLAIGLNLLEIKKIRLGSLLPGLVITPVLVWVFATPNGILR